MFGGNSPEHNVSVKSVKFILNNINKKKYYYEVIGITKKGEWIKISNTENITDNWEIKEVTNIDNIISYLKKFDIVLPIIHGNTCEDGKIQSMLELFNIKYVGSNSYSSIVSYDKILTKLILDKYNIPQVPYIIYNEKLNINNIHYPVIVKPAKCGSSIGISIANNKNEFKKSINIAKKYDTNIVIEKYITNRRELECAIINKNGKIIVSNIGEIITKENTWYNYNSKYERNTSTNIISENTLLERKIKEYSKNIFKILGCKGLARVDFLVDNDKNMLYFNEINTIPGLTNISMFPKLLNNINISNSEIIDLLISS